jgi:antitoxin VapB
VRLPEDIRFPGDEVRIRRHGSAVILEPIGPACPEDWAWLDAIVGKLDEDFVKAALERPKADDR